MNPTLDEQITCIRREIAKRERVYAKWVESRADDGRAKAHHDIECMKAVLGVLMVAALVPVAPIGSGSEDAADTRL